MIGRVWRELVGKPLRSRDAGSEEIGSIEGLPALSLDALTSVAYGPEAILLVLGTAGLSALHLVLPVTVSIVVLLSLLVTSYRQVIDGYPTGGGAYAVSRANLGTGLARLAAASLIVDYTLTVAVSIAAGVAALTSAFPALLSLTVPLCLVMLGVIALFNLRGLGDAARAFLVPTGLFIVGLLAIIAVGLVHPLGSHLVQPGRSLVVRRAPATIGVLLILKAFSSGCSALTGVEAIANGVPLFRSPRVKRAKRTELLLGLILGAMLLGLAVLADRFQIGPRAGNTVLSQIMTVSVGRGWAYYLVSLAITVTLGLAANTSFGGLPVLASLLAADNYLPHAFGQRSNRLVYSRGVIVLAVLAGVLLVSVRGNTNSLIPLFAIGVFTGFTLAQAGMVVHWRRSGDPSWRRRAIINATGAVATAIATVIFLLTKFTAGGWVVVVAVPLLMVGFWRVHAYYQKVGEILELGRKPAAPAPHPTLVVVPVTGLSWLTAKAISNARSFGTDVVAVRVSFADDDAAADRLQADWTEWDPGVPLVLLHTDYHSVVQPILGFIREAASDGRLVMVLIPMLVPRHWRHRLLHNQLDLALSASLAREPNVVVARSRFRIAD